MDNFEPFGIIWVPFGIFWGQSERVWERVGRESGHRVGREWAENVVRVW